MLTGVQMRWEVAAQVLGKETAEVQLWVTQQLEVLVGPVTQQIVWQLLLQVLRRVALECLFVEAPMLQTAVAVQVQALP